MFRLMKECELTTGEPGSAFFIRSTLAGVTPIFGRLSLCHLVVRRHCVFEIGVIDYVMVVGSILIPQVKTHL